jgi:hypothetical protein
MTSSLISTLSLGTSSKLSNELRSVAPPFFPTTVCIRLVYQSLQLILPISVDSVLDRNLPSSPDNLKQTGSWLSFSIDS